MDATTAAATLRLGDEQATLSDADVTTTLAPGPARVARDYLSRWPPRALDIERAIADIEDALMQVHRKVGDLATVASGDPVLRKIAAVARLDDTAHTLPREAVESVFERLAAVALGRPNAQAQLPEDVDLAAAIMILREVMHHLDIQSIEMLRDGSGVKHF